MKIKSIIIPCMTTLGFLAVGSFFLIELPPRIKNYLTKKEPSSEKIKCDDIKILGTEFIYGSCPNNTYYNDPGDDYPSIRRVKSCTDSIGGRISCNDTNKNFNSRPYNVFLIGDSFIQAEEMEYEKSMYGLLSKKNYPNIFPYGFGFGSYNSRQYLKAIQFIKRDNSLYDIYLFSNDFAPSDPRSTYTELQIKNTNKSSLPDFITYYLGKSLTLKKINTALEKITAFYKHDSRYAFWSSYEELDHNSCPNQEVSSYITSFSDIMQDYIMFSFPYECWGKKREKAYELVKNDLLDSINVAKQIQSKIRIIFIPPGFSFKYENTPGRYHPLYSIPNNHVLRLKGLQSRLQIDFPDHYIEISDSLSSKLSKERAGCDDKCSNIFYFGHDGHFNAKAHKYLFDKLYNIDELNKYVPN